MEKTADYLNALLQNEFRGCFDGWKARMELWCSVSRNYTERDSKWIVIALIKYFSETNLAI
jgi:hypothetical protein